MNFSTGRQPRRAPDSSMAREPCAREPVRGHPRRGGVVGQFLVSFLVSPLIHVRYSGLPVKMGTAMTSGVS